MVRRLPYICDPQGSSICSLLSSCGAISKVSLPVSTCCLYMPVNLDPSFEMDLPKLQCSSYSALYGYNGAEFDPEGWNYGLALKYKFTFDNDYPVLCKSCEKSNGVCGYNDDESKSFASNCSGGLNKSTNLREILEPGFKISPLENYWALSMFLLAWFFTKLDFM